MRFLFSEPRRLEVLANGKTRCYYDETISEESAAPAGGEPGEEPAAEEEESSETVPVYSYAAECEVTKGRLVDALVRTRYSQGDVEAILRHKMNGDEGADDEFDAFNTFAEACKAEAVRILGVTEEAAE